MIADSWSANRWNEPSGAGSETTRGLSRAAGVFSRGARASTDFRPAVSSVKERAFLAWTTTFRPGADWGLEAFAQKSFVS